MNDSAVNLLKQASLRTARHMKRFSKRNSAKVFYTFLESINVFNMENSFVVLCAL
jgi:hypothetical protein